MAYIVAHRHGTKDDEFEAYVRLLERWGIDWTNTARTPEPGSRHRWLHVWQQEDDAQRFAGELREATRDDGWFVHRLHEEPVSTGALGPIDIYVGRQSDGCTYSLHPNSRRLIRRRFPQARQVESIFIRSDVAGDLGAADGSLWGHVAQILTGLSAEDLQQFGGYRIYDPDLQQPLYEPTLTA